MEANTITALYWIFMIGALLQVFAQWRGEPVYIKRLYRILYKKLDHTELEKGRDERRIYTLVETAKANGLNLRKYIRYILSNMMGTEFLQYPEFFEDYLPWD